MDIRLCWRFEMDASFKLGESERSPAGQIHGHHRLMSYRGRAGGYGG